MMAYRQWRRPDDAKRRADSAQQIVRKSQELETIALAARIGTLTVSFDHEPLSIDAKMAEAESVSRGKLKTEELEARKNALNEFRTYRAEATVLFKGTNAVGLMDRVERSGRTS